MKTYIDDLERQKLFFITRDGTDRLSSARETRVRSATVRAIERKARELYWTVTRAIGLGHLHDGSRENAASQTDWIEAAQSFLSRLPPARLNSPPHGGRILIDVTETTRCGFTAGSSRTVAKLADFASRRGDVPVVMHDGALWTLGALETSMTRIEPVRGDFFLIADASWHSLPDLVPIMERMSADGIAIVLFLYDILPITHPPLFPPGFAQVFGTWLDQIVARADAIIAISEHVARDFVRHVRDHAAPTKADLKIGWTHLGSDIGLAAAGTPSARIAALCEDEPFLLMVSTVEPRKGHSVALAAMERLWNAGTRARLVLVGRRGWQIRSIVDRIKSHREYGRRLVWIEDGTDDDLRHLYARAHLSIYPSVAEGFGLPIVEASAFGLEVVASDIAVFREIASDNVTFFEVANPIALAERLSEALARPKRRSAPKVLSWSQASDDLMTRIHNADYQLGRLRDAVDALS